MNRPQIVNLPGWKGKNQEMLLKDLEAIIDWATNEMLYVETGMAEHSSDLDFVEYYRYIRKVKTSI